MKIGGNVFKWNNVGKKMDVLKNYKLIFFYYYDKLRGRPGNDHTFNQDTMTQKHYKVI